MKTFIEEINDFNNSSNKAECYGSKTKELNEQIKEIRQRMELLNVLNLYIRTKEMVEQKIFEENRVKYINLFIYDDGEGSYNLRVVFLDKENVAHLKDDPVYKNILKSYAECLQYTLEPDSKIIIEKEKMLANQSTSMISKAINSSFPEKLEVNDDLPVVIKDLFLSEKLKPIFDYSLMSSKLNNNQKDEKTNSKMKI